MTLIKLIKYFFKVLKILLLIFLIAIVVLVIENILTMRFRYNVVGNYNTMKQEIKNINSKINDITFKKDPGSGFFIEIETNDKLNKTEATNLIEDIKQIILKEKNFTTVLKERESPHYFLSVSVLVDKTDLLIKAIDPVDPPNNYPPEDISKKISLKNIYNDKHVYVPPNLKWSDNLEDLFS